MGLLCTGLSVVVVNQIVALAIKPRVQAVSRKQKLIADACLGVQPCTMGVC